MRYIWDQYHVYRKQAGFATRLVMPRLAHRLRIWDAVSALRVDGFVANSNHVARRIQKYYRRDADVVYPPVAVDSFAPVGGQELEDFYLWAGELAPYKRPDLAVEAFGRMRKKLVVIGDGGEVRRLRRSAPNNVSFLGQVPFETLKWHLARCRALIYPGEEDFGIVPVEAMASGRPVIAYGQGGVLDTVKDGETGVLFDTQNVDGLVDAVERFERDVATTLSPDRIAAHARQFDQAAFTRGIADCLSRFGITVATSPTTARR